MSIHDGFDWKDVESDVVVPEQSKIAVFTNDCGNVVIREAGQYCVSEDMWIVFHPRDARRIAEAILEKAGADMAIVPLTSLMVKNRDGVLMRPFPNQDVIDKLKEVERAGHATHQDDNPEQKKDRTAAVRQRRRREKKQRQRDGVTDAATERDSDRDTVTTAPALPEQLDFHGGENTALTH
jgi:hypothetical protein